MDPNRKQRIFDKDWNSIVILGPNGFGTVNESVKKISRQVNSLNDARTKLRYERRRDSDLDRAWDIAEDEVETLPAYRNLPEECREAFYAYTLESPKLYQVFNDQTSEFLQGRRNIRDFNFLAMNYLMMYGIAKEGQLGENKIFYRGVDKRCRSQIQVGEIISFPRYTSSSASKSEAMRYARGNRATLFTLEVSTAMDISGLSDYPNEQEFLIPYNVAYRVANIREEGDIQHIYLKEIKFVNTQQQLEKAEENKEAFLRNLFRKTDIVSFHTENGCWRENFFLPQNLGGTNATAIFERKSEWAIYVNCGETKIEIPPNSKVKFWNDEGKWKYQSM